MKWLYDRSVSDETEGKTGHPITKKVLPEQRVISVNYCHQKPYIELQVCLMIIKVEDTALMDLITVLFLIPAFASKSLLAFNPFVLRFSPASITTTFAHKLDVADRTC